MLLVFYGVLGQRKNYEQKSTLLNIAKLFQRSPSTQHMTDFLTKFDTFAKLYMHLI